MCISNPIYPKTSESLKKFIDANKLVSKFNLTKILQTLVLI